jgi:hypothetical protein
MLTASGVPLALVRVGPEMAEHLAATPTGQSLEDEGVRIELDDKLNRRIEFFRWQPKG